MGREDVDLQDLINFSNEQIGFRNVFEEFDSAQIHITQGLALIYQKAQDEQDSENKTIYCRDSEFKLKELTKFVNQIRHSQGFSVSAQLSEKNVAGHLRKLGFIISGKKSADKSPSRVFRLQKDHLERICRSRLGQAEPIIENTANEAELIIEHGIAAT